MKALAARFVEESSLELHDFLSTEVAERLEAGLRECDIADGLGSDRATKIPLHSAGTGNGWTTKGPPHKWRYNVLDSSGEAGSPKMLALQTPQGLMRSLQNVLFPSPAFRAWLAIVSRLLPMRYAVEARRFCPGLGYTLATSEESEARLDVVLGLTPQMRADVGVSRKGKGKVKAEPRGWPTGHWGGWEVNFLAWCSMSNSFAHD